MKREFFRKRKGLASLLLAFLLAFLTACEGIPSEPLEGSSYEKSELELQKSEALEKPEQELQESEALEEPEQESQESVSTADLPEYGSYYYDLENVVLYLEVYGELPPNYITKKEARELGWEGGSVEDYLEGAAIGGDTFGNREGLLPEAKGRTYTECDIDTKGFGSRGSRRLVFSDDGLYFYTADHYESFSEVTVTEDWEVIW